MLDRVLANPKLEVPSSVQVTFESLEAECGREGDPLKRLWWCRVNLRAP